MKKVHVTETYSNAPLARADAEVDHRILWEAAPVIGQRVALRIDSRIKGDVEVGTYVGVFAGEDGRIEHWFIDGEIDGRRMAQFSIPAAPGTVVTDHRSPDDALHDLRVARAEGKGRFVPL